VLFGAEITYTLQYHRLDPHEKRVSPGDPRYLPYYGVRAVLALMDHFHGGRGPLSSVELTNSLNITHELADDILYKLTKANIAANLDEAREKFLPARDLDQVTLKEIVEAMQGKSLVVASVPQDHQKEMIESFFEKSREAGDNVLNHTTITDITKMAGSED
jgi:membrane protein